MSGVNPGALLGGVLQNPNPLLGGRADGVTVTAPVVTCNFDVSATYLRENACDVALVIGAAQAACVAVLTGAAPGATITATEILAALTATPGVLNAGNVAIGGGSSFVVGSEPLVALPSNVRIVVGKIA